MTPAEIQAVFSAQTENVRELDRAWNHINRDINAAYADEQDVAVSYETKLLTFVYCALGEAVLSKLIHTPHGFSSGEIQQIKAAQEKGGVRESWKKCIELSIARVSGQKSSHVPNVRQTLNRLVDTYIHETSVLRNKIAHGQWVHALNRENTAVNAEISSQIHALDAVELCRRKRTLERLWSIVEDIVKSPNRAHHRDYWMHISKFEEEQKKMESWSVQQKIRRLREKKELCEK